ncbi:hypothetical protein P389DRAFT_174285 [Cystobasidium minutum MCA 4210]|uniref:uncharacterized protein n=1 Tax=Cystobasidium minutum MCA 4210 TaxID=1397322 RepID=UPI0034CD9AED|eukprot:jgi/Rhomi1/174285/fgenesh1_kg.7_\
MTAASSSSQVACEDATITVDLRGLLAEKSLEGIVAQWSFARRLALGTTDRSEQAG